MIYNLHACSQSKQEMLRILKITLRQIIHANIRNLQKQSSGGVLKYFAKFTEKHLCQSLFFNRAAG